MENSNKVCLHYVFITNPLAVVLSHELVKPGIYLFGGEVQFGVLCVYRIEDILKTLDSFYLPYKVARPGGGRCMCQLSGFEIPPINKNHNLRAESYIHGGLSPSLPHTWFLESG